MVVENDVLNHNAQMVQNVVTNCVENMAVEIDVRNQHVIY